MGIGTSLGGFFDSEHHFSSSQWDPKYDDNEYTVEGDSNDPDSKRPQSIADTYDTPLNAEEQAAYNQKFSPQDSTDYDMQGFFKGNPDADPHTDGTHYPDTYKKPNHPTFSDESMYNGVGGNQGGSWGTTATGQDTFTPGPTNMKNLGLPGLIDYFDKVEPDALLLMPKN